VTHRRTLLALGLQTWQPDVMNLGALPLQRRLLFVLAASTGIVFVIGVIVGIQYLASYNGAMNVQQRLTPAAELADNLLFAQSSASGDLSDYVLTDRKRALTAHETSVEMANSLIRSLEATFDGDLVLLGQLAGVRAAQQVWLNDDADPTLAFMDEGRTSEAARATNLPKAWDSYDSMIATTTDLRDAIEEQRAAARVTVDSFGRQLGLWLFILAIVVVGLVVFSSMSLNRWVLRPLRSIRRDLTRAAQVPHTHPVTPRGPPELHAVAVDAEDLRRTLVTEIDEATAAREGLVQDAPLVAALQQVMQPPGASSMSGVVLAGTSSSAEGVLAGDWWDAIELDDHRLALVVADTSGHGTGAVLTALRTRDLLRAALAEGRSPADALALALEGLPSEDNFVTAFVAIIDSTTHSMTFSNAGHPPPVLITIDKNTEVLSGTGPLLSTLAGVWEERTTLFAPGSLLLAYTDGLIEGRAVDGDDLVAEDLSRMIRGLDGPIRQEPTEVLNRVVSQIRENASAWHRDDVTAVVVGCPVMAI
jgi:CHASE3 domain sensor protein